MSDQPAPAVSAREALRVWAKVALHSFGGPAGQIAVVHRLVVDEKRWLSENRFLHALSYCMLLPGPEAQQLATYVGWLLRGVRGGLVAGSLFILPGFVAILALSILYARFGDVGVVAGVFLGLKPAVTAVVFHAVGRLRTRALDDALGLTLATAAFVAIFAFGVPFPLIVLAAGLVGLVARGRRTGEPELDSADVTGGPSARPSLLAAGRTAAIWLLIWFLPLGVLGSVLGSRHIFVQEGAYFSKVAVVTFGGAYAVLSYVAQKAVETFHWLGPREMLDGLGLAETTPGPLIQVVQFVGFMGAYRNPGALSPLLAGVAGSVVTTWVTFAPCFLFIFVGAPFVEYLRTNRALTSALRGITAAVVGVVLNLAVWFTLHTLFTEVGVLPVLGARLPLPALHSLDGRALVICLVAMIAMFRFKVGMMSTLGGAALAGLALHFLF